MSSDESLKYYIVEDFFEKMGLKKTLEKYLKEIKEKSINYNKKYSFSQLKKNETILSHIFKANERIILNNNNSTTTNINFYNNENLSSSKSNEFETNDNNKPIKRESKNFENKSKNNNINKSQKINKFNINEENNNNNNNNILKKEDFENGINIDKNINNDSYKLIENLEDNQDSKKKKSSNLNSAVSLVNDSNNSENENEYDGYENLKINEYKNSENDKYFQYPSVVVDSFCSSFDESKEELEITLYSIYSKRSSISKSFSFKNENVLDYFQNIKTDLNEYKKKIQNMEEVINKFNENKKFNDLKNNNNGKFSKKFINNENNSSSKLNLVKNKKNFEEKSLNKLSKCLFLYYRLKYKLFHKVYPDFYMNFNVNCVKCDSKIYNIIYDFNDYQNLNENNQNYNLCQKCLSQILKYISSNLIYKYLPEFKSKNDEKKQPSIFVKYIKLTDEKNIQIKENDNYNILYSFCKDEIEFNLTFKYINCNKGLNINGLSLYKNDGSGFVTIDQFFEKKNEEIKIAFKLRNLQLKYFGKYERQIYFKYKNFESNRFTFYINISN